MYLLSEEQLAFKKELRAYCDAEIRPAAEELDRAGAFPRSLFARAGELGYLDISFSPARAGAKYGALAGTIILEEFSRGLPALSLAMLLPQPDSPTRPATPPRGMVRETPSTAMDSSNFTSPSA